MKPIRSLFIQLSASNGDKEPPEEFQLFHFGLNKTIKGDFMFTRSSAQVLMARYREHAGPTGNVRVNLDYEHMSHDPEATPEQKKASGWGDLELRDDGLWLVNIKWTKQADGYLRNGEYAYSSPAFFTNDLGEIDELVNVALTNLPATHDQEALVAASRVFEARLSKPKKLNQGAKPMKKTMAEHLKACMSAHGGAEGLANHLGMDHAKLMKHMSGDPMTHEEMKSCATKLGIQHGHVMGLEESELEEEDAPIDTSYNGTDVNASMGGGSQNIFQTGAEAAVPTKPGEASENQGGMLRLSRSDAEALLKDRRTLVELTRQVDNERRKALIKQFKPKLTPRLIALSRKIATADLAEFLEALPEQPKELHAPAPEEGAARQMITLTREDREVAKLSGRSEKDWGELKEKLGDHHLIMLRGEQAFRGQTPAYAGDKEAKTDWDRRYADHFMMLSMTDRTPDGKPWKPGVGSVFKPASALAAQAG